MATSYYKIEEDITQSTTFASAVFAMLEQAVVEAVASPTTTITKTIKFLGEFNVGSQLAVESYDIIVNGDNNSVSIGGSVIDMSVNGAGTLAAAALLGLTALGPVALAIGVVGSSGVVAVLYSHLLEDDINDALETLAGKDMVQFFDILGNEKVGLVFPDGIPAQSGVGELDAVWAFITNENSAGLDLTGGHIQVDTGLGVDDNYYVYDGAIYDMIANHLGITTLEFRTTQNGSLTNDAFFAEAGHGNYIFFEEEEIEIGIPVTIGGVDSVVMVQNVYGNGAVSEANRLIGDDELFEENLILGSGSGAGGDGRDLIIGGTGGDLITGGDGDDILLGLDGNDTIEASEDDDTIDGGDGDDLVDFSVLDAWLDNDVSVNLTLNTVTVDYLLDDDHQEIYHVEHVKAGGGDDAIWGTVGDNSLMGGEGDDMLRGNGGNDTLIGGDGDDALYSEGGSMLQGGIGNDYYSAKAGDVISDPDGGNINNIQSVYGHTGEHLWQAGSSWRPFSYDGSDLRIYTGNYTSASDQYYTIADYVNDGRWGFSIAQQWLDAGNPYVIAADGTPVPTNNVFAGGGTGPVAAPAPATPAPDAGNPSVSPNGSNQHEYGYTNSVNYFAASAGFDTQAGGASDDIYAWSSGSHHDMIMDSGGTADRIILSGLNAADLVVERYGDDARIRVIATNEWLTIQDHFVASQHEIETLEYADGTTLNLAVAANGMSDINESATGTSAAEWFEGYGGDDTLDGGYGNDTLVGGLDDDTLKGNRHDDVYRWAAGDGNDTIIESNAYNGGNDTLHFAGGITLMDLDIFGVSSQDVVITYLATGEFITLQNQVTSTDVEQLSFDDGSTFDLISYEWRGSIDADTLYAGTGNDALLGMHGDDSLYGSHGHDTLTGGLGADTLNGDRHDDVYRWAAGDGNDTIIESNAYNGGNDTLHLIGGITFADVDIWGSTSYDVKVTYIPTGETITIENQASGYDVETLFFDDGFTYNMLQGIEWRAAPTGETLHGSGYADTMLGDVGADSLYGAGGSDVLEGNAGNDTLYGYEGHDTLRGDAGDDLLKGYSGNDTYIWGTGDGNDIIQEAYISSSGSDILHLTSGITAADISFSQSSNDLIITHTPTGETITIDNQYASSSRYDVETLLFDDASTINLLGV